MNQEVSRLETESFEEKRRKDELSEHIERAEEKKEEIRKEYIELQENTLEIENRYITKIQQLEKVLKMKTDQLLVTLKNKE